ncbi:MAG: uracil-DNA glycosylase [Actinomycetota bacterium]|nr:uracil-DNA glycosylase [Actinomycetota bacterium]
MRRGDARLEAPLKENMFTFIPETAAELIPLGADLDRLRAIASGCTACDLYKLGTQTVWGEGTQTAGVMLVGEQPGDKEDLAGRPFVGPAGRLSDSALG